MAKGKGTTKCLGPGKYTTVALGSKMEEGFAPGWDAQPGANQHQERVRAREAMGQKKTPIGKGKLERA